MYFGKFEFSDLFDVNGNILLRGAIRNEDLLMVNIQDFFNMPCINSDAAHEFQHNSFNQENMIFLTINKTIESIGRNRFRYMVNVGLTSLPYSDMDNFYTKYICKTYALGKSHKKSHNKSHAKCPVKDGRWYADLTKITGESFNGNYYVLGLIVSNTNAMFQYFIP